MPAAARGFENTGTTHPFPLQTCSSTVTNKRTNNKLMTGVSKIIRLPATIFFSYNTIYIFINLARSIEPHLLCLQNEMSPICQSSLLISSSVLILFLATQRMIATTTAFTLSSPNQIPLISTFSPRTLFAAKSDSDNNDDKEPIIHQPPTEPGSHSELMYALGVNLARQLGDIRPLVENGEELTLVAKGLLDTVIGRLSEEGQVTLLQRRRNDLNTMITERA